MEMWTRSAFELSGEMICFAEAAITWPHNRKISFGKMENSLRTQLFFGQRSKCMSASQNAHRGMHLHRSFLDGLRKFFLLPIVLCWCVHISFATTPASHKQSIPNVKELLEAARTDTKMILAPEDAVQALARLAESYCHSGDPKTGNEILEHAKNQAGHVTDPTARLRSLFSIAEKEIDLKCGAPKDTLSQALALATSARNYSEIVELEAALGEIDKSLDTVTMARGAVMAGGDVMASMDGMALRSAYRSIAIAMAKAGQVDAAKAIASQVEEGKDPFMAAIAVTLAEAGNNKAAAEIAGLVNDESYGRSVWAQVAFAQSQTGNFDVATKSLKIAEAAYRPGDRGGAPWYIVATRLALADAAIVNHDLTAASEHRNMAFEVAKDLNSDERRIQLCAIAQCDFRMGHTRDAENALGMAAALGVDTEIVDAYLSINEIDTAIRMSDRLSDLSDITHAKAQIAVAKAQSGESSAAKEMLQTVELLGRQLISAPSDKGWIYKEFGYRVLIVAIYRIDSSHAALRYLQEVEPDPRRRIDDYCDAADIILGASGENK